ncbi:MAG: hypothetical protein ACR2OX_05400 [Methyloligellaceae bacterium]
MKKSRFASVHGGLLARKGQASPAIPSPIPHVSYTDAPPAPQIKSVASETGVGRRDIKLWSNQPLIASKNHNQTEPPKASELVGDPNVSDCDRPRLAQLCRAEPHVGEDFRDHTAQSQISLQLTPEQRRRVRTIAAQLDWSDQKILSNALDDYLENLCRREMKGCACLNKRLGSD